VQHTCSTPAYCRRSGTQGCARPILISVSVGNARDEKLLLRMLTYVDVDTSMALQKYYELLASILHLLVSVFLSRGQQNQQIQHQMRNFLTENRLNMVGAFKRYRGIGGAVAAESRAALEEVVRSYVALMSMADFMQVGLPHSQVPLSEERQFEESDDHTSSIRHGFS
jgi:Nuclear pore complex scaffold, nucleoporins 186/192/205